MLQILELLLSLAVIEKLVDGASKVRGGFTNGGEMLRVFLHPEVAWFSRR